MGECLSIYGTHPSSLPVTRHIGVWIRVMGNLGKLKGDEREECFIMK
jgi:hypothetical protein